MIRKILRWLFNWSSEYELDQQKIEQNLFSLWAFGYRTNSYSIDELHAWNDKHKDLLELKSDGCMSEDIKKMKALYQEYKRLKPKR